MFEKDSPAKNITEVIEYLSQRGANGYLFRGQGEDYELMTPSGFRKNVVKSSADGSRILLSGRLGPSNENSRESSKLRLHERLVKQFGRTIGNIIAQQYGVSSDIIDVTSNPNVAAFFATKGYPTYEHIDSGLGVIYTFPHRKSMQYPHLFGSFLSSSVEPKISLLMSDLIMGGIGAHDRSLNSFFWFVNWKLTDFYSVSSENDEIVEDFHKTQLHTQGIGLSYRNISDLWEEAQQNYTPLREFNLDDTRIKAQVGGLMRPVYLLDCIAPKRMEVYFNPILNTYVSSQFIRPLGIFAVDNLHTHPKIEKFYFLHTSNIVIDLAPEELWPEKNIDPLFGYLCDLAEEFEHAYLSMRSVEPDDFSEGLLDGGFQKRAI